MINIKHNYSNSLIITEPLDLVQGRWYKAAHIDRAVLFLIGQRIIPKAGDKIIMAVCYDSELARPYPVDIVPLCKVGYKFFEIDVEKFETQIDYILNV